MVILLSLVTVKSIAAHIGAHAIVAQSVSQPYAQTETKRLIQQHVPSRSIKRLVVSFAALMLGLLQGAAFADQAKGLGELGPFGPEGPRMREQLWMLPSANPVMQLRATVFRPDVERESEKFPGSVRHPMVVINHGTSELNRLSVAMPIYYWMSRWFVERGYVVVLPQRRGHGATGGSLAESVGTCSDPDHLKSGSLAADDIEAAVNFMSEQPFVAEGQTVVVGVSTGGWASLALAARNPRNVHVVINFAGGRGGHAYGAPNTVCGEKRLIEAAAALGASARIPTLWLYAANDSYFGPELARAMADAWTAGGGLADLRILPEYGDEGHELADDRAGTEIWGPYVDQMIEQTHAPQVAVEKGGEPVGFQSAVEALVAPVAMPASAPGSLPEGLSDTTAETALPVVRQ